MLQNHSNLRINFNDICINDSLIQETNKQNPDYNLCTYSNNRSINPNDFKIGEELIQNDYFFSPKNILQEQEYKNENPNDEIIKGKTNEEKTFTLEIKKEVVGKTEILELKNNLEKNAHLGRKRKNDDSIGGHNKFSDDNLRRKSKNLIIDYALDFLNEKINNIYKGNLGKGIAIKKLFPINRFCKLDASIEHNKNILNKTLGDIFSISISDRYKYYSPNHNEELIKRLLNEKDEKKRIYFKKLFNITFLECLKRFCGNDDCEELKDFKKFSEIKNKFRDGPEYINKLESYLKKFENNIKSKKGRKKTFYEK